MKSNTLDVRVPRSLAGERLDDVLASLVGDLSRARLQKLVRRGAVHVDGQKVLRSNIRVRGHESIRVEIEDAADADRVQVVYVDDQIAVVYKPAGVLTHANENEHEGTLPDLVERELGPLPMTFGEERPGIVHRLDRETSGILVLGRTDEAMESLKQQFKLRRVEKLYLAIVHGVPAEERFNCGLEIGPSPGQKDRQRVRPPSGGKEASTEFEVRETFFDCALLACRPRTGRRHQIRVHLHAEGHPILGDALYRPPEERERLFSYR